VDRAAHSHARFTITITKLPSVFTGTGDLTSALILAHATTAPKAFAGACEKALTTVQAVCRRTMAHYDACTRELAAAKAAVAAGGDTPTTAGGGSGARKWIIDAAASSSGQMGSVVPVFNELRLVQSKGDIEAPVVPADLRAAAVVL